MHTRLERLVLHTRLERLVLHTRLGIWDFGLLELRLVPHTSLDLVLASSCGRRLVRSISKCTWFRRTTTMVVGLVTNLTKCLAEYSAQSTPSTWNFLVHANPRHLTILTTSSSAWPCSRPSPRAAPGPVRSSAGTSYSPSAEMNLAVLLHIHKLLLNFILERENIIDSGLFSPL